jgi:hypothetical protein
VTINPQKTRIVHVRHGFEFLGYKIKRGSRPMNLPTSKIKTSARRGSLYAYPREKSINHFKEQTRRLTRRCAPVTTRELIQQINPVVRGWGATTTSGPRSESSSTDSTDGWCGGSGRTGATSGAAAVGKRCHAVSSTASTGL